MRMEGEDGKEREKHEEGNASHSNERSNREV